MPFNQRSEVTVAEIMPIFHNEFTVESINDLFMIRYHTTYMILQKKEERII